MKTKAALKLESEALSLFGITDDPKRIGAFLWALKIRDVCGRCGGSGSYSYCQSHGTTCFKCGGKGEVGAKLTVKTLAAARVKVEAGELEVVRAERRALFEAKKAIAPMMVEAKAIFDTIANLYTERSRGHNDHNAFVRSPIFHAQTINNDLYWGTASKGLGRRYVGCTDLQSDVRLGIRMDYLQVRSELAERIELLRSLRDAFIAFEAL
jgi:hypothetical protein